jgi:hypothetical protein
MMQTETGATPDDRASNLTGENETFSARVRFAPVIHRVYTLGMIAPPSLRAAGVCACHGDAHPETPISSDVSASRTISSAPEPS